MKRVFALVCLVLFAFSLAVIGFAHPSDNKKEFTLPYACIEVDNLEDVLMNEFEDEYAEEIRDAIVYTSDTELFEFGGTYYVEYESLRDTAMYQYGENITERIFSHPDLIVLTPEDFADRYGREEYDESSEDNITEYTEEYEHEKKEEKQPTLNEVIDDAVDMAKYICIALVIMFLPGILAKFVGYLKDRFINKKK